MGNIITLLTDFGYSSGYVASMKGVILRINPTAKIIDISHGVDSYNLKNAAFILYQAYKSFPNGTIHVVVVDPGVGSDRHPILIKTEKYFFIGPDNGVFTLILNDSEKNKILKIENPKVMLPVISTTFHGRDIFAPSAAHLSKLRKYLHFGPEINKPKKLNINLFKVHREIEILHIDKFGNIITSLKGDNFKEYFELNSSIDFEFIMDNHTKEISIPFKQYYDEVPENSLLCLIGSTGFLEISSNQGNARDILKLLGKEKIKIKSE